MKQSPDYLLQLGAGNAALSLAEAFQVARPDSGIPRAEGDLLTKERMLSELVQLEAHHGVSPEVAMVELLRALGMLAAGLLAENGELTSVPMEEIITIRRMELLYGA
ncbi:hypothetical protein ACFZCK_13970 [Kitasatospora purpeofusca]|uniref:hypothetical protein n=1 Tax=Kitasatospora purpeofusca TaxID=67352 RepID=UPI0036E2D8B5